MTSRMGIEERYDTLTEYMGKLEHLTEYFMDERDYVFAPHDSRNYGAGYDAQTRTREYDDIDTPLMCEIVKALENIQDKLRARIRDVDAEADAYYEAYEMFRAWELGLCPYVMREYRREPQKYVGGAWDSRKWSEIAGYLDGAGMSREGTRMAVEAWQEA